MGRDSGDEGKTVKVKRPKRRVKTPLKTGTIVHKSPKTYTRKEKHKKRPEESGDD
jgi:hypothetical protein